MDTKSPDANIGWALVTQNWNQASLSNDMHPSTNGNTFIQGHPRTDPETGWEDWNITSVVQNWISNPSQNFGIQGSIMDEYQYHGYRTSEYADITQRPKLTITYASSTSAIETQTTVGKGPELKLVALPSGGVEVRSALIAGAEIEVSLLDLKGNRLWTGKDKVGTGSSSTIIPASATGKTQGPRIVSLTSGALHLSAMIQL